MDYEHCAQVSSSEHAWIVATLIFHTKIINVAAFNQANTAYLLVIHIVATSHPIVNSSGRINGHHYTLFLFQDLSRPFEIIAVNVMIYH